jgi:hypothetical protein
LIGSNSLERRIIMVVAQQRFTHVRGVGADKALYQRKSENPVYGEGESKLLFRIWHPSLKVHELGLMGIEARGPGISVGKPIWYYVPDTDGQETSNVKTIEVLSTGPRSTTYKAVTETGSIYHVVILK